MKISLFQVGSRKMKDRWGELRLEFRKRLSRLCGVKGVIHASITRVGGKPSHVRLRHLSCKCTRRRCATGVETWSRLVSLVHFLRFDTILLLFSGVEWGKRWRPPRGSTTPIQEDGAGHRLTFSARASLRNEAPLYCNHTFVRGEIKPLFMGLSTNNRRDSYRENLFTRLTLVVFFFSFPFYYYSPVIVI